MKKLLSSLIAIVALVVFAGVATAKPPSWDKVINGQGWFKVLNGFNGEAVLDKETGLVWEQSPSTALRTWFQALTDCYNKNVGGRKGWRLPTIEELASLVDPNNPGGNPDLPPGNPFDDVQASFYWSATTEADLTSFARDVNFSSGGVGILLKTSSLDFVWCVRGGQGHDGF